MFEGMGTCGLGCGTVWVLGYSLEVVGVYGHLLAEFSRRVTGFKFLWTCACMSGYSPYCFSRRPVGFMSSERRFFTMPVVVYDTTGPNFANVRRRRRLGCDNVHHIYPMIGILSQFRSFVEWNGASDPPSSDSWCLYFVGGCQCGLS